ncbi:MAG: prolyl oligopeptidase family serine peptidase [Verrucomicrobiota bacterium]
MLMNFIHKAGGWCLVIFLIASANILFAQTSGAQTPQRFEREITKSVRADYLLFLPADYDKQKERRWPLILFLHGAGERGTNLAKVKVHGPPKLVASKPEFPFIVISPQCPDGQIWSNEVLMELIDHVTKEQRVDTNRIYLTGLSMGGYGTWSLALAHPDRFAAIAPICGGGSTLQILLPDPQKAQALRQLPVWAFHGAKDKLVVQEETERMIQALKRIGNQPRLTIYPEAEHDSWTETYNNQELYDWFLQHDLSRR